MKLKNWHRCRRYWNKGYHCPFQEEEEHEEDDDRHQDVRELAKPRELGDQLDDLIRITELGRKRRQQLKERGIDTKVIPFPKEGIRDKPQPVEIPPVAAITPGVDEDPWRPVGGETWETFIKNWHTNLKARFASTVPEAAKAPATSRVVVPSSVPQPSEVPVRQQKPLGVMGAAEETFTKSLPQSGTVPGRSPRNIPVADRQKAVWEQSLARKKTRDAIGDEAAARKRAAGAATAVVAATAAYAVYRTGGGGRGRGGFTGRSAADVLRNPRLN